MAIVVALNNKRQSRAGLSGVINYVANDRKTLLQSGEKLVSGINCSPHSAYDEFMLTKHLHSKTNGKYFYHYCQSFSPEEKITPETVHEIGVRLTKECFEGYEVIVGTHIEKNHLHNHIIVNSVSFESGKKLHQDKKSLENIRTVSDKICSEYGLSVIKHKKQKSSETMTHGEYTAATLGNSWKFRLINTIEAAMNICKNKAEFISYMESEGYKVSWTNERKSICYTTPGGKKCRDYRLHEDKFLKENMEYEFRIRREIERGFEGYGESADQESGNLRPLYGDHGCELEGVDRGDEYAGRYAFGDTGFADQADNERGTHLVYGSADRDTDRVRREQSGADRTVHGDDGADGDGIYRTDEYGSREFILTGWENERAILTESLFGAGNGESVYEAEYLDLADSDSGADRLGIDSAYLFADLTNIIDEDAPVEDCTTMHQPRRQKKNTGPVMGGM